MTISKDRVKPSPYPNSWNLSEIFTYAIVYGIYLAASTVAFFAVIVKTSFFHDKFGREQFKYEYNDPTRPGWNDPILHSIIYLQVSTISQALIFVTRSRSFFFLERPSIILVIAFIVAQMIATFIAVYANWGFTDIRGCGWAWAGIVWVWNIIWFFPLDLVKVRCEKLVRRCTMASLPPRSVRSPCLLRSSTQTNHGRGTISSAVDRCAAYAPSEHHWWWVSHRSTVASFNDGQWRRCHVQTRHDQYGRREILCTSYATSDVSSAHVRSHTQKQRSERTSTSRRTR